MKVELDKFNDKDYHYWNTWKENKDDKALVNLMDHMQPFIYDRTKHLRGVVPDSVLDAESRIQAANAFRTYSPNKGTKLSTHVGNQLQKTNRLIYSHMDAISIPEARRIKYKNYDAVKSNLTEELGRPPTTHEMADDLGWSLAEIRRFESESWKELSDSVPSVVDNLANSDPNYLIQAYVYHDLSPQQQKVYEMTTGFNGVSKKSDSEIMRHLRLTRGQLSYAKTVIKKALNKAIGQHGG